MGAPTESLQVELCEEHAEEAAFLWQRRSVAVHDAAYDAPSLAELDERVEAHLSGLRLATKVGAAASMAALEEDPDAGTAFAVAVLAVGRWDLRAFATVLDVAGKGPAVRGIVSAIGWAPAQKARALLPGLLANRCPPALWCIGIAAAAVQREDPGAALGNALCSSDERLLARALKAAGELGRHDVLSEVRAHLRSTDATCAFRAGWSATLLGDPAGVEALCSVATQGGPFAEPACATAMRRVDPRNGASWLSALAAAENSARVVLAGAAALGDPALVPWLLDRMEHAETARRAAFSFAMITGLDVGEERLTVHAPKGFSAGPSDDADDDDVAMDPDDGLPWPDVAAVRAWWAREGKRFQAGVRHLLGKPLGSAWLEQVLRTARQPAREAAAMELVLGGHRRMLPEVRARAADALGG